MKYFWLFIILTIGVLTGQALEQNKLKEIKIKSKTFMCLGE